MQTQLSDSVAVAKDAGMAEISLHRPERKNALNRAMYAALSEAVEDAVQDDSVRVLLLAGSEGCFTSGNDLADFANASGLAGADNPVERFMTALANCPKPVVVAVEGVAVGIGTTVLLHADLVYAAADASFRTPFVNLGLCAEYGSSWLLPRLVGHVKAAEWLLLGEAFDAAEAQTAGLINAVVDNPLTVARQQALKLCAQPPEAVRATKMLMKQGSAPSVKAAMERELEQFGRALQGREVKEAVTAFFEKRKPDFSGF